MNVSNCRRGISDCISLLAIFLRRRKVFLLFMCGVFILTYKWKVKRYFKLPLNLIISEKHLWASSPASIICDFAKPLLLLYNIPCDGYHIINPLLITTNSIQTISTCQALQAFWHSSHIQLRKEIALNTTAPGGCLVWSRTQNALRNLIRLYKCPQVQSHIDHPYRM